MPHDCQMRSFQRPLFCPNAAIGGLTIVEASAFSEVPPFQVNVPLDKQAIKDIRDLLNLIEARGDHDL